MFKLKCVGGSAGCSFVPNVVQCYNRGTDGVRNVQVSNRQFIITIEYQHHLIYVLKWECKAELPESITFGSMQVSCEGYDNKEDPYILVDSCGVCRTMINTYCFLRLISIQARIQA